MNYLTKGRGKKGIEDFFSAPVVNRKWKIDRTDPQLVRFGLMWKIYDMVAVKGINFRVPILDVGTGLPLGGYVLGGISGTDFLVSALGLTQPKAGRGIKWLRVDDSVDIVDEIRTIARANQRFDESCELAARRALEELDPSLTPAEREQEEAIG
ncbi:hypothetical protein GQ457_06G024670 [Hibiscus cannabinus]